MDKAGHVDVVAREKDALVRIAINGLRALGYRDYEARDKTRLSILLWNIVSSWYKSRVFTGYSRKDILEGLGMKFSGGTE